VIAFSERDGEISPNLLAPAIAVPPLSVYRLENGKTKKYRAESAGGEPGTGAWKVSLVGDNHKAALRRMERRVGRPRVDNFPRSRLKYS